MASRAAKLATAIGAVLAVSACQDAGPSAETVAAERAAVAADRAARAEAFGPAADVRIAVAQTSGNRVAPGPTLSCPALAEGPNGTSYRPRPLPPGAARILSARSLDQGSGGGCNIEIGYPGAEPAFVVARTNSCEEEPPRVYSVRQIREAGQLDDLAPADRADIERLERIGVVGVETEFSWVVYVPDRACTVREVSLAD